MTIEGNKVEGILDVLADLGRQFAELQAKKKKIQIYQKTMDMGTIEPFNNVEETKALLQ